MSTMKKYLLVCLILVLSLFAVTAQAATVAQDGLDVTLTVDKAAYEKGDWVHATLAVENNSGESLRNISVKYILPEEYLSAVDAKLVQGSDLQETNGVYSQQASFVVIKAAAVPVLPHTGDHTPLLALLVLAILSGAVLLKLSPAMRNRFFSLVLCVVLLGSLLPEVGAAKAAEVLVVDENGQAVVENTVASGKVQIAEEITVAGDKVSLIAEISYIFGEGSGHDTDIPVLVSATGTTTGVTVKWNAVSGNTGGYRVYRRPYNGTGWTIVSTKTTALSFTDTTATAGVKYFYNVGSLDSAGKVTVNYSATGIGGVRQLATPQLLSTTASTAGVTVRWNAVSGATAYYVMRRPANGTTWTAVSPKSTATTFTDKTGTAGVKYVYSVRCLANDGKSFASAYNTTGLAAIRMLATPTLVSATATTSGISVKWNAVEGATTYWVIRKTEGGSWATVKKGVTGTTYVDSSAKAGVKYYYTVRCLADDGATACSGYNTTGVSATAVQLAAPTLVSATGSATGITVKWQEVPNIASYWVIRKTEGGSWGTAKKGVVGTTYTDTTATPGVKYYYTVRCLDNAGTTAISGYNPTGVSAIRQFNTPTLVSATGSTTGITVKWNAVSGVQKYWVIRKTEGGSWGTAKKGVTGTTYTDTTATPGVKYYYTVRCMDDDGVNALSGYNATGVSAIRQAATPTLVSATAGTNGITFKWNAVSGVTKYWVIRKTEGGSWATLKKGATGTSYVDTTTTAGVKYYYTVRCLSSDGTTAISGFNATGVSAVGVKAAPTLVSATGSTTGITVKWNAASGTTKYWVIRKAEGGSWATAKKGVTGTTYTDTTATPGVKYYYTVRCLDDAGTTATSGYDPTGVSAIRLMTAPTLVSATNSETGVTIRWNAATGITKYWVIRKQDGGSWVSLAKGVTGTSYTDTTAKAGVRYYYTVRCLDSTGTIAASTYDETGICGALLANFNDGNFTFRFNADLTGAIVVKYIGTSATANVPNTIRKLPIVEVAARAFENNTTVTAVNLPDTVKTIGERAFAGCTNLSSMY